MTFRNQKEVNLLSIWDHQKEALNEIGEYIKSFDGKSFLVKMPTGTGKTGVFASLTRVADPAKNYLIVTPSTALKFQIIEEIKTEFWRKIAYDTSKLESQYIDSLLPTNFSDTLIKLASQKFILVTTIQAIQSIAANKAISDDYETFQKLVDCIIFDEGHKEPAYTWGETIRSFKKPTVLFSATPYRNDYKIFNVNKEKFYSVEHSFCVKQNYLRDLEIIEIASKSSSISQFLTGLLSGIKKLEPILKTQKITNPKIIIRCENHKDISAIVNALLRLKRSAVGIHETFTPSKNFSPHVPTATDQPKYEFYVHQFKLIEGIDNPDFCVVALFSDFKSSRLLIQQIGRVLRNPKRLTDQKAFLFCKNASKVREEWNSYLDYDKLLDSRKKLFDITDILKVNKEVSTLYFSGTFRELVNIHNLDLKDSILFQKKVNAYHHEGTISFKDLSQDLIEEWNSRDYNILKTQFLSDETLLILYIKYENSPLVKKGVFIEQTLAVTFLKFKGLFVYYYDSIQSSPMGQFEDMKPVTREQLVRLFKDKRYINKVFLMNTDIGGNNLRNKELQAGAVENTAPGLSDYSYFPARIEGNVSNNGIYTKRYIGFQNGRITDFTVTRIDFNQYLQWIDELHVAVLTKTTNNKISSFLNRFSERVDAPSKPTPTSILLDIDESILERFGFGENLDTIEILNHCATIDTQFFTITINDTDFLFEIEYDIKIERFRLHCPEMSDYIFPFNDDDGPFLNLLNSSQSFRLVLKDNQYVYAHKSFFRPSLNLSSKKKELDLNQLFHSHKPINEITSEKGSSTMKIVSNLWSKDTLFGLIARQGVGYNDKNLAAKFKFEYLLCDDLSTEIADFIALDVSGKRVVFIHAKAKQSKLSASNFTEICGQATKNLDYLTPYYQRTPTQNISKWKLPWSIDKIGKVSNRIITNNATSKQFWDLYTKLISDPSTSREVWLVVGGMFDISSFNRELNKPNIKNVKSETIQLIYLLRSTWNSVSQVGGQLKIFC